MPPNTYTLPLQWAGTNARAVQGPSANELETHEIGACDANGTHRSDLGAISRRKST